MTLIDERGSGSKALLPFRHLAARLAQNPAAEQDNEFTSFSDGNELSGLDKSAFRVIPANQRLEPANVDDRWCETIGW